MGGFSSVTGDGYGTIMNADNASFDGTARDGKMTLDGELWIGSSVAPHVRKGFISPGSGISIMNNAGSITIGVSGSTVGQTITGNTGGALSPTAGNWNIINAGTTVDMAGSGSTLTQNFGISNLILGSDSPNITSGGSNVGLGQFAMNSITTGASNVGVGVEALSLIDAGLQNVAVGTSALSVATNAQNNVAIGTQAMENATTIAAILNTALGHRSLQNMTTGARNICVGALSGQLLLTTESDNIYIGYNLSGLAGENNTIRIGTASQTSCYITGIDGVNVGSVAKVLTMASNQIGTATITAGSGVTVTPGANTITIACTGGGIVWTEVTGTSQNAAVNNAYVANNAALVTITLPATFAVGDIVRVAGLGAGLWRLAANTGDIINFGSSPTSAGGSLTAINRYDCVEVVGVAANSTWVVLSAVGNLTVA